VIDAFRAKFYRRARTGRLRNLRNLRNPRNPSCFSKTPALAKPPMWIPSSVTRRGIISSPSVGVGREDCWSPKLSLDGHVFGRRAAAEGPIQTMPGLSTRSAWPSSNEIPISGHVDDPTLASAVVSRTDPSSPHRNTSLAFHRERALAWAKRRRASPKRCIGAEIGQKEGISPPPQCPRARARRVAALALPKPAWPLGVWGSHPFFPSCAL
jgi:hypothetical protein